MRIESFAILKVLQIFMISYHLEWMLCPLELMWPLLGLP